MISSETNSPASMTALARRPVGEPADIAARSMSPVAKWQTQYFSTMEGDCVPFPDPGGPNKIALKEVSKKELIEDADVVVLEEDTEDGAMLEVFFSTSAVERALLASILL